jgi:hypothetical protein
MTIHQDGLQRASAMLAQVQDQNALQIVAAFQAHIRDHMAQELRAEMFKAAGIPMQTDPMGNAQPLDPQTESAITTRLLAALPTVPMPQAPAPPDLVQSKIDAQSKLADAEAKRKDTLAAAELARKDQAAQAEQARKDEALRAEQRRKDAIAGSDLIRRTAADHLTTAHDLHSRRELAAIAKEGAQAKLDADRKVSQLKIKAAAKPAKKSKA